MLQNKTSCFQDWKHRQKCGYSFCPCFQYYSVPNQVVPFCLSVLYTYWLYNLHLSRFHASGKMYLFYLDLL